MVFFSGTPGRFLLSPELITGPVFTAKGCIRLLLGYLGRFWPVFGSQKQFSKKNNREFQQEFTNDLPKIFQK